MEREQKLSTKEEDEDDHIYKKATANAYSRKSHRNTPSFSSTLLDEIYHSLSMEDGDEPPPQPHPRLYTAAADAYFTTTGINHSNSDALRRRSSISPDYLSWREDRHHKIASSFQFLPPPADNLDLLFSSTSPPAVVHRVQEKINKLSHQHLHNSSTRSTVALKIYARLKKKLKQPISPGPAGKLTNFINSFFTTGNGKKKSSHRLQSSSEPSSTCSVSRRHYSSNGGDQPRVIGRFNNTNHPVDQQHSKSPHCSHTCSYKSRSYGQDYCKRSSPLPPIPKKNSSNYTRAAQNAASEPKGGFEIHHHKHYYWDADEEEDKKEIDDAVSESSSDLFEIDHLAMLGSTRSIFTHQLPVYETTYLF